MEDELFENSTAKLYVGAITFADRLNRALKVRLGIFFNQEQLVTDEVDNEREEFAKKKLPICIKKQTIHMLYIRQ